MKRYVIANDWTDLAEHNMPPPFVISKLSAKNVKVCRPTLFNYIYTPEEFERYTGELWELMTEDNFEIKVHEVYPLEEVRRAHTDLESRKTSGKLLLKP